MADSDLLPIHITGAKNGAHHNSDLIPVHITSAKNGNAAQSEKIDEAVAVGGSDDASPSASAPTQAELLDALINGMSGMDGMNGMDRAIGSRKDDNPVGEDNNNDSDDVSMSSTAPFVPGKEDKETRRGSQSQEPGRRVSYADSVGGSTRASTRKSSASRRSTSFGDGIWGRLARKSEAWEMDSLISVDSEDELPSCTRCIRNYVEDTGRWLKSTFKTAFTTPSIVIPSFLLFVVFTACGLAIVHGFDAAETNSRKQTAQSVAEQTDLFFVRVLERAFVPLFTMAQFIQELPEFHLLDLKVGDRCDAATDAFNCTRSSSAPPLTGKENTHRNLTTLLSTDYGQMIQNKFDSIAAGIKANSGLGKSLVNIQLAPKGVVSMLYPIVNCEDFDNGWCMNNTGARGHDLLNDVNRVGIARATVPAEGVVTAGPLPLIQGGDTFIARLAINFDEGGHSMVVDDVDYPCWGFAVVLIDWARLKEESNIYENFETEKMQFKLTRTDIKDGKESVKVIAESSRPELIASDNVTLDLDAGDNNWVITVGYDDGFSPNHKEWAYPIVFCSSFAFAILVMLVLVSKKEHEIILSKLLPRKAIKKMRKGKTVCERYKMVTIFFSDIVGYTKMSSEMTPTEVMKMLNDLYTKFDALADKHDVYKLETIGDAYLAIGGAPKVCPGPEAAEKIALFALDVIQMTQDFRTDDGSQVFIRAGLASGPVVAGVVGNRLPKYSMFGDTVNFAARMEQSSKKMRLQISPSTQRMLLDAPNYDFEFEPRYDDEGELGVELKGKGRQYTYWVNGATKLPPQSSRGEEETVHAAGSLHQQIHQEVEESQEKAKQNDPQDQV